MEIYNYLDKSKVLNREIDRLTYARDASIYRIAPEFAVRPSNEKDIQQLFKYALDSNKYVTFRASGTSLSGQTVTDGIIVEIAYDWQKKEVKDNGSSILLEPGVIGEHANQALDSYQRRIGPDPASIKAARIGGIIANNASGMTTGRPCNSYNTLKNIRFILPNGNIYDTSNDSDCDRFNENEKELVYGLSNIRDRIFNDKTLENKIIDKYRIKNTIGYSLNSFIDFDKPLDIFAHLLIGSEGTLAFVSNIEMETVPNPPYKSAGLVLFKNIQDACNAIGALKNTGVAGLELMDYASLLTAKYVDNAPYNVDDLANGASALLCEFQEFDDTKFDAMEQTLLGIIKKVNGTLIGSFARDEADRLKLWKIRNSLFTTVGSMRRDGTSVITEDICFDIKDLGDAIIDLHEIFSKWKYEDAVVFGHAKDGNLHFNLSIDLKSKKGINDYHKMMDEVVQMSVEKYNGSLKAEHGTGRNMAPYVEYEWGSDLYNIMWKIKKLADPNNILNPGVILNKNKDIHIENLKPMPAVHNKIDLCVECGFCEPVCPSRSFTFTPRNRITVSRELKLLEESSQDISKSLLRDYNFNTQLTCAVDGMCELNCPININTGEFVKGLRKDEVGKVGQSIANWIVANFNRTTSFLALLIRAVTFFSKIFGKTLIPSIANFINRASSNRIPTWNAMITGGTKLPKVKSYGKGETFIYYPSCISRTFNADIKKNLIVKIMAEIAEKTNIELLIPEGIEDTCCSTPFSSKGFEDPGLTMFNKAIEVLYKSSSNGKIPIVIDTSPCTYKFLHPSENISDEIRIKWKKLTFIDIIPFLNDATKTVIKTPIEKDIVLHPTCSTHKMEHVEIMRELAERCANKVVIPQNTSCCGFAGDRGMIVPDLTKNAVELNKSSLTEKERKYNGYSSSRMCEIGVSEKEQTYVSIALLVRDYLNSK